MSGLFENHIVGFPTRRLICIEQLLIQFMIHDYCKDNANTLYKHCHPEVLKVCTSFAQVSNLMTDVITT